MTKRRLKIGSITPLWNQELFIKPHFELLSKLDRNVVLLQPGPLPNYHKEHGYSKQADLSEELLKRFFPNVEIYPGNYPTTEEFGAGLYNEGLLMMRDCDIVFRLDPDMLWSEKDFDTIVDFVRETSYDSYRMHFNRDSVNYYETGQFDYGLKDAQEFDALAVNPNILFSGVLDYPTDNTVVMGHQGVVCHHFRGWNKPRSTPAGWHDREDVQRAVAIWGYNGGFFSCPNPVRSTMESWLKELHDIKEAKKSIAGRPESDG